MPHGGEEVGEPELVLGHVGCLLVDLHHENSVSPAIQCLEGGGSPNKLVAQHDGRVPDLVLVV